VDPEWFKRFKLANEVCHTIKLMKKEDRIKVYRVIRDGVTASEVHGDDAIPW
jgi:hypothetical protein